MVGFTDSTFDGLGRVLVKKPLAVYYIGKGRKGISTAGAKIIISPGQIKVNVD